jgi:hypothetical protein
MGGAKQETQPRSTLPPEQTIVPVSGSENARPLGAMPAASTPPIAVPSPGGTSPARATVSTAPQVESYDVETYRCKAGDSFDKISTKYYNTANYAQALLLFNINDPQATDNIRHTPPIMEPGQPVYIPPAHILEKRYGTFIPGYKPQPAAAPTAPQPSAESPRTSNAAPRADGAWNAPQGFKWYQVQPRGESMRDIARTALNDAERWRDISKLNPTIPPEYMVRGGVMIKVPADARIETVTAPAPR